MLIQEDTIINLINKIMSEMKNTLPTLRNKDSKKRLGRKRKDYYIPTDNLYGSKFIRLWNQCAFKGLEENTKYCEELVYKDW